MGLLENLFPKQVKAYNESKAVAGYFKTLTAYQPVFRTWSGKLYESELVRSSIDARARHISKLKVEILGNAKPKLKTIIKKSPNPYQTWSQFLYRLATILDMTNTAFIVPIFDRYMEIVGYYCPYVPSWELVRDEKDNPWLRLKFLDNTTAVYKLSEVGIMTKFQFKEDFFGSSNDALTDTMALINIQNQGIEEAIKNGATYRFMAQANNFAKTNDLAKERERFSTANFQQNGGGLLLFPNTYTNIQQIKASPYTVDTEQRNLIQQNVYNYYGVNEEILQNKAYGDAWSAFYEGAIEVFAIQFSEVISKMTYTPTELAYGSEIMATSNRLQYLSNADKLNVSSQMADRGIMTRNEIRDIWNLPPLEGGDIATIRGEYYLLGEDGSVTKHEDDLTGKENNNE